MTLNRRLGLWLIAAAIGGMTMGTGATALAGHGSCGSWNSHASRGSFGGGGLFGRFRGNSHHNNCYNNCYDHHANYNSCGSAGQTPTYSTTTAYADDCGCGTTTGHAASYGTPTPVYSDQQGYQQESYQDVPPPPPADGSSSSQGRSAADGSGSPPPPPGSNNRSGNQQGQPSGSGSGDANDPERA